MPCTSRLFVVFMRCRADGIRRFIQSGHPDLASYASVSLCPLPSQAGTPWLNVRAQYISITSTIAAMLGEVAIINLLTYYIGRRKVLFNEYALLPKFQYGSDQIIGRSYK